MTNYIIIALCVIVLVSYLFDITSKYSKIPSVILLIALGILAQLIIRNGNFKIPNLRPILPVIGTLGLILIVLDASLDIKLERGKTILINRSIISAVSLLIFFVGIGSFIMIRFLDIPVLQSFINTIPLGIISSAVAISSSSSINPGQREFIVYESAFSDIIGILVFDFILINYGSVVQELLSLALNGILTIILAIVTTSLLAILLHKIRYHVNYVIIMTLVVLIYVLAKLLYLPALLLVLSFGLSLSNYRLVENTFFSRFVDFEKFQIDLDSFRKILGELTFLVRSFFFIMFGYYTMVEGLFKLNNILIAISITALIYFLRWILFGLIFRMPINPFVFFAPRGLITILLYLSIPAEFKLPLINEEVVTLVILMTIMIMFIGNITHKNNLATDVAGSINPDL